MNAKATSMKKKTASIKLNQEQIDRCEKLRLGSRLKNWPPGRFQKMIFEWGMTYFDMCPLSEKPMGAYRNQGAKIIPFPVPDSGAS